MRKLLLLIFVCIACNPQYETNHRKKIKSKSTYMIKTKGYWY